MTDRQPDADSDADYEVGYGRPPKQHRIRKGEVRNPRGRPKKESDIVSLINRELDQVIWIKEGSREIRVRKREAMVKRLVNNALGGHPRAIEYLVAYCEKHNAGDPFTVTAKDRVVLQQELQRLARTNAIGNDDDDDDPADDGGSDR